MPGPIKVFAKGLGKLMFPEGTAPNVMSDAINKKLAVGTGIVASGYTDESEASFLGKGAKFADEFMLGMAEKMEKAGITPDEIWQKTGWGKGADDKWRFEISDELKFKTKPTRGMGDAYKGDINEYISSPTLSSYDFGNAQLKEIPGGGGSYTQQKGMTYDGKKISPDYDEITVGRTAYDDDRLKTVGHELQHAIQRKEGFARGGSPDKFVPDLQALADLNNMNYADMDDFQREMYRELKEKYPDISDPHTVYKRLAGEVEARNVEARIKMTDAERRATPPWKTEDVPRSQQILASIAGATATAGLAGKSGKAQARPANLPLLSDTITAANHPRMMELANLLRTDTALGPLFEGVGDLLEKHAYDDERTFIDYMKAALDLL